MLSIVYVPGPLTPEFLQLRLDIVNSAPDGRIEGLMTLRHQTSVT